MPDPRLRLLVGAKLRLLRARAGLTLAEIARRMGSHRPIVGRLESGLHDPALETIGRYCAALGVDPRVVLAEVDLALGFRPCGGADIAQQPRGGDAHGAGGESPHPVTGAAPGRPTPGLVDKSAAAGRVRARRA